MMEHDFFDMYLEEMRSITPLERDEMVSVLEGTARGDAGARSRLVEGCLGEVLEIGDDLFMKIIVTFSDTLHLH